MYAIVKTGGKQYHASQDEILVVEKLEGNPGETVELDEVLMISEGAGKLAVGSPVLKGAKVKAEIIRQAKGKKINAFNYKPKKNVRKRWGHRQLETHLKVTEIVKGK